MQRNDLTVVVGSYMDRDGNQKNKFLNIGSLFIKDDGQMFITLNRTFNPAGVPLDDKYPDTVMVNVFKPRQKKQPERSSGGIDPDRDWETCDLKL